MVLTSMIMTTLLKHLDAVVEAHSAVTRDEKVS